MEAKKVRCAGGAVLSGAGEVALVQSRASGSWLLPKGHVDEGESDEEAARREIREEAGLHELELLEDLGEFTRPPFAYEQQDPEQKVIRMFLFRTTTDTTLSPSMEVEDARWVPVAQLMDTLGSPHTEWFPADRAWLSGVIERIQRAAHDTKVDK